MSTTEENNAAPQDSEYRLPALCTFGGLLIGIALARTLLVKCHTGNDALNLFLSIIPLQILGVALALVSLGGMFRRHRPCQVLDIPAQPPSVRHCLAYIALALIILYPAIFLATEAATLLCNYLGIPVIEQAFAKFPPGAGIPYILTLLVAAVVLAPLSEELIMRLLLFRSIRSYWPAGAAVLASLFFAAFHGCPQYTPGLFLVGMALQKMRDKGGLPLAIVFHAVFNAISLAMVNFSAE